MEDSEEGDPILRRGFAMGLAAVEINVDLGWTRESGKRREVRVFICAHEQRGEGGQERSCGRCQVRWSIPEWSLSSQAMSHRMLQVKVGASRLQQLL